MTATARRSGPEAEAAIFKRLRSSGQAYRTVWTGAMDQLQIFHSDPSLNKHMQFGARLRLSSLFSLGHTRYHISPPPFVNI